MNTVDSLYRYYKKLGPTGFEEFIQNHPEFSQMAQKVKELEEPIRTKAVA